MKKTILAIISILAISAGACLAGGYSAYAASKASSEEISVPEDAKTFTITITDVGVNKVKVIKILRAYLEIDLKEAYDLVAKTPVTVKENVEAEEAEKVKAELEEAGAKVELKAGKKA